MHPTPFAQFVSAGYTISCFHGTNYLLVENKLQSVKIAIPGESVEAQAAAAGPNLVWLSLTGDTITPCAWYRPLEGTWGELDLSPLGDRHGHLRALPQVFAPRAGLPVWWILTGYESPETCLVVSLKSLETQFELKVVGGDFISAKLLEEGSLKLRTTQGEIRL